jgi:hypothetical protein
VEVVVIEECLDRGLGVVADNHNWPADVAAGVSKIDGAPANNRR